MIEDFLVHLDNLELQATLVRTARLDSLEMTAALGHQDNQETWEGLVIQVEMETLESKEMQEHQEHQGSLATQVQMA